jgi:hypothetical protein
MGTTCSVTSRLLRRRFRSMETSNSYVIGRVDVEGRVGLALGDGQQS